jgi:hypothetical protein
MFVDFRASAGPLEARAKKFHLFRRDRGSIKPAHEFRSRAPLARAPAALGKKHAVSANARIKTMMRRIELIQHFCERIA